MELSALFPIVIAWLALCGSFFLAIGIIKLKPDIIARLSQAYCGLHFDMVDNLALQKADFICGVVFIVIAFLSQIIGILVELNRLEKYSLCWTGVGLMILIHLLPFLFLLLRDALATRFKNLAVLAYCRNNAVAYISRFINKKRTVKGVWSEEGSLLFDAKEYCGLKISNDDTFDNFLKRYIQYLRVRVPEDFDWDVVLKKSISQIE